PRPPRRAFPQAHPGRGGTGEERAESGTYLAHDLTSQTSTCPDRSTETVWVPDGVNPAATTGAVCFVNVARCFPVAESVNRTPESFSVTSRNPAFSPVAAAGMTPPFGSKTSQVALDTSF